MKQKKLMLLGGSHYLMPAIYAAHKLGVGGGHERYEPRNTLNTRKEDLSELRAGGKDE